MNIIILIKTYSKRLLQLKISFVILLSNSNVIYTITLTTVILLLKNFMPIKVYSNFYNDRAEIRKDHKNTNKSGIYMFINLKDLSKIYIGQSINLLNRFNQYLNNSYLESSKNNQVFPNALLKYGQDSFALVIIEYLPLSLLNVREIFWIKLLNPYYNIHPGGGSNIGIFHNEETKDKIRKKALGRKHSEESKSLISESNSGSNNSFLGLSHTADTKFLIASANSLGTLFIYNSFKILLFTMVSVLAFAKFVNSQSSTIVNHINHGKLFRGNWDISRKLFDSKDKPKYSNVTDRNSAEVKEELLKIKNSILIKKAVFVFSSNDQLFIDQYSGILECANNLKISHNIISKLIDTRIEYKGYIFSSHRIL